MNCSLFVGRGPKRSTTWNAPCWCRPFRGSAVRCDPWRKASWLTTWGYLTTVRLSRFRTALLSELRLKARLLTSCYSQTVCGLRGYRADPPLIAFLEDLNTHIAGRC